MRIFEMKTGYTTPLALALALSLSACGGSDGAVEDAPGIADRSGDTLAQVLNGEGDYSSAAGAFERTGLISVLEGEPSYTLFAPHDDAFGALGKSAGAAIEDSERGAIVAAILRGHMVPGALTTEAIRTAIADKGGPVTMTSLGSGDLVLRLDGDDLVVDNGVGQTARIRGDAIVGKNGVVIPIDAVLVAPEVLNGADQ